LEDADNAGLENVVASLEELRAELFPLNGKTMGRGDFWTLSGLSAVEYSVRIGNEACEEGENVPNCDMDTVSS